MLVLTRKIGESLMIGEGVTVTLLGMKGRQARIGVQAPADVSVDREEIFHKKNEERLSNDEEISEECG